MTWLDELNKIGYFEPVGVHQDFHRRGLGRALMLESFRDMQRMGMVSAEVGHEIENSAASGLYSSLGFQLAHEIADYIKH